MVNITIANFLNFANDEFSDNDKIFEALNEVLGQNSNDEIQIDTSWGMYEDEARTADTNSDGYLSENEFDMFIINVFDTPSNQGTEDSTSSNNSTSTGNSTENSSNIVYNQEMTRAAYITFLKNDTTLTDTQVTQAETFMNTYNPLWEGSNQDNVGDYVSIADHNLIMAHLERNADAPPSDDTPPTNNTPPDDNTPPSGGVLSVTELPTTQEDDPLTNTVLTVTQRQNLGDVKSQNDDNTYFEKDVVLRWIRTDMLLPEDTKAIGTKGAEFKKFKEIRDKKMEELGHKDLTNFTAEQAAALIIAIQKEYATQYNDENYGDDTFDPSDYEANEKNINTGELTWVVPNTLDWRKGLEKYGDGDITLDELFMVMDYNTTYSDNTDPSKTMTHWIDTSHLKKFIAEYFGDDALSLIGSSYYANITSKESLEDFLSELQRVIKSVEGVDTDFSIYKPDTWEDAKEVIEQ